VLSFEGAKYGASLIFFEAQQQNYLTNEYNNYVAYFLQIYKLKKSRRNWYKGFPVLYSWSGKNIYDPQEEDSLAL
jgi:hypothetical protein